MHTDKDRKELVLSRIFGEFHPKTFVITMGTGMSSLVLYNFPWDAYWLRCCSYPMFACCSTVFVGLMAVFLGSCVLYPQNARRMFLDADKAPFWGCFSMGFSSIISYLHFITGERWVTALFTFWIMNVAVSIGTSCVLVFVLQYQAHIEPKNFHISMMLLVVTQNVVATVGGVLYSTIHPNLRLFTIIASFLCWGNGLALTGWLLSVYFWKLFFHNTARGLNKGFAAFVPIGAFGQGAFGILLITDAFRHYVNVVHPHFIQADQFSAGLPFNAAIVGESVRYLGMFSALFLVANGFFFTCHALMSVLSAGIGWYSFDYWSATFPLGTMALASRELYALFHFGAFRVVAAIYAVSIVFVTLFALAGTVIYDFPHEIYRPRRRDRLGAEKPQSLFIETGV